MLGCGGENLALLVFIGFDQRLVCPLFLRTDERLALANQVGRVAEFCGDDLLVDF